jgi:Zn-dependent protease with chaperone function
VTVALVVPLLVALVAAVVAPPLTRRMAPGPGAWTLTIASVGAAAASLATLGLLAWLLVAELPPVAELGRWRPGAVASASPVPAPVTAAALAVLAWLAWRVGCRVVGVVGDARAVVRMERSLPSRHGPARLVVVSDPVPAAHAVARLPGCGGHIVVSTGILEVLTDAELRHSLYEHERAHLRHHHTTIRLLADLAAAVNPLLGPARRQVGYLVERWADEDAATATSRAATAEALAIVSLAAGRPQGLAFHAVSVPARVAALLDDRRPCRTRTLAAWIALAGLLAIAAVAIAHACHDTEILFENIRRWSQLKR